MPASEKGRGNVEMMKSNHDAKGGYDLSFDADIIVFG
jgi:hypothetical protein